VSLRDAVRPIADGASELVTTEIDYWRDELERPWRDGPSQPAARIGRWIGLTLAIGAAVAGVAAALRVERPWD